MSFGTTCLVDPSRFPDTLDAGSRWGEGVLDLELPGGPYRFVGLEANQESLVRRVLGPRVIDDPGSVAVTTQVFRAEREEFLDFERVDWKILIDVDYHPQGVSLAAHQWMGRLDWSDGFRGSLWTPVTEGSAFTDLFENFFRIAVAYRLLAEGGLLVHSAGVADDSGGYLFPGASGNGKSTISKISLAEGRAVLSDDGNAVFFADEPESGQRRLWVQSLPFGGEMRDRVQPLAAVPLRRLAALIKGTPNRLETMGRAEASALLLGCTPFVNGDPHRLWDLLSTIEEVLGSVEGRRLTFTKTGGFWPLVREDRLDEDLEPPAANPAVEAALGNSPPIANPEAQPTR